MNNGPPLCKRPVLSTKRLSLRCPSDDDVDTIVSIVGDWEVARRLGRVPYPYGAADARFFLEEIVPVEWVWAVTLQGSDALLGAIGLTPKDGSGTAELGYWLSPTYWGQGLMTEAATAVVSFGFESLGLPVLTSGYFMDNPASGQVLRKLGFVEVGRAVVPCLASGADVLSVRMERRRRLVESVSLATTSRNGYGSTSFIP